MGTIEESGGKRKRKRNLKHAILSGVQALALTGIMIAAPNLPQALYKLGLLQKAANDGSTIGRARRALMKQGLLAVEDDLYRLTRKGKATLAILQSQYSVSRKRRWDGRWRVLVFDIPEYRKSLRDKIRRTLMHIGFVRLQDSVWVYPYDCEDLIALLKADFKIGKDILYMIVDEMEGDPALRREFHFPKKQ